MERISSGQTFFMKRIFPWLWLGFIGIGLFMPFMVAQSHASKSHFVAEPPPFFFMFMPVLMLAFGIVLFRKLVWNLADSVDEAREYLLVRRGGIEQRVLLSNVMNVGISQFTNPQRITLRLRTAGPLGDEIAFIPKSRGLRLNPFQRNEIAERLIRRVDEARLSGDARR